MSKDGLDEQAVKRTSSNVVIKSLIINFIIYPPFNSIHSFEKSLLIILLWLIVAESEQCPENSFLDHYEG